MIINRHSIVSLIVSVLICGCGGGGAGASGTPSVTATTTYTIGGSVSGLTGTGLVLQNNGGDNLPDTTNGSIFFTTPLAANSTYSITVYTQPSGQTCTVTNGAGPVSNANVTNIAVSCVGATTTYTIGGSVSGLTGTGLVLQNNGGDNTTIPAGIASFNFTNPLAVGSSYNVTVLSQPIAPAQICTVVNGSGTASSTPSNIIVSCAVPVSASCTSPMVLTNGVCVSPTVSNQIPSNYLPTSFYTDGYAAYVGNTIYYIGIGSATDIYEFNGNTAIFKTSKVLGDSNAWNTGVDSNGQYVVIAGPYQYSWQSPTFYGTDIGVYSFSNSNGSASYTGFPQVRGYDWNASVSTYGSNSLIVWSSALSPIAFSVFDPISNSYTPAVHVAINTQNGILSIQNLKGAFVSLSGGAAVYDGSTSAGHDYRIAFFDLSGVVTQDFLIQSQVGGSSTALTTSISASNNLVATAIGSLGLNNFGDSSGSGILVSVFSGNGNLIKQFLGNATDIPGDQVSPNVLVTNNGNILLEYQDSIRSSIFLQLFDTQGNSLWSEELHLYYDSRLSNGPNGTILMTIKGPNTGIIRLKDTGSSIIPLDQFGNVIH